MFESQNSICSDEAEEKMTDIQVEEKLEFNSNANYKDALLASLYNQVIFRGKNLLLRTLIIKESEVYQYCDRSMIGSETASSSSFSTQETINETNIDTDTPILSAKDNIIPAIHVAELNPHDEKSINDVNDLDDEIDFQDLYLQYVKTMEGENREKWRRKQLGDVLIYLQNVKVESILDHNHTIEIESQNERIKLLKHSTGFATKIMKKMGYKNQQPSFTHIVKPVQQIIIKEIKKESIFFQTRCWIDCKMIVSVKGIMPKSCVMAVVLLDACIHMWKQH